MKHSDISSAYRSAFKAELDKIKTKAKEEATNYINSLKLSSLSNKNRIEFLHSQMQTLAEEYKKADYKKYILFSEIKYNISHINFTNLILKDTDETDKIEKAIIFTEKHNALIREINSMKPDFKIFLSQSTSFKFYTPNTPTEHFYKKREVHLLIALKQVFKILFQMQYSLINKAGSEKNINKERSLCQNNNFSNLIAYKNSDIEFLPYNKVINEQDILENPSQELTQSLALNLYINWLKEPTVLYQNINFNKIFNQKYKKQLLKSKKIINKLKTNIHNLSNENIEKKLKALEQVSKRVPCPVISKISENKHHIKSIFFASILINADIYTSLNILKSSILISNLYDFYIQEYIKRSKHLLTFPQALNHLASMGTHDNIFNPLIETINKNEELKNINELPLFPIYQETVNSINNAFQISAYELEEQYEDVDINKASLHSLTMSRHLHTFKNRLSRQHIEINPLTIDIENIIENVITYKKSISIIDELKIKLPHQKEIQKIKPDKSPDNTFGYKKSDPNILRRVASSLHLKINLFIDEKTIDSFVKLLTSNDIYSEKEAIRINCQTNQFAFFLYKIKPLFHNLDLTRIERTNLFFSSNNTPIKASNLYVADTDSMNRIHEIKNILKQFDL